MIGTRNEASLWTRPQSFSDRCIASDYTNLADVSRLSCTLVSSGRDHLDSDTLARMEA